MGITFVVVALVAVLGLTAVFAALVNRRRSISLAVAAVLVAIVTAGGAWYAWTESQSALWTLGYGAVAVVSLVASIRQCVIGREPPTAQAEPREKTS